jgi:hypothetical protein
MDESKPRDGASVRNIGIINKSFMSYGEWLLASHTTLTLEDHSLSAVGDGLFSIFEAALHI